MPGSHYPFIPPISEPQGDYECLRCGSEVTSATRREITGDGWAFWRLPSRKTWDPDTGATTEPPGPEVALCGYCAGMMRTLQAIRACRGVGEIRP